jgi:hypothetical protein
MVKIARHENVRLFKVANAGPGGCAFLSAHRHQTRAQVLLLAPLDSAEQAFPSLLTPDGQTWAKDVTFRMRMAGKSSCVVTYENELLMT